MGFLGLAEPIEKEDNLFKRLFWPGANPSEVDTLGQQGFWICVGVAILSAVVLTLQGSWGLALLTLIFFGLGGIGVREHSTVAAILVALAYLANILLLLAQSRFPGFLSLVAATLLLANIRGTWIAAKFASAEPGLFPERSRENWRDRLVDQMPPMIWPKGRAVFYCAASVYMVLLGLGTVMMLRQAHANQTPAEPGKHTVLQVAPPK